ncbi:hypothetical protein [Streptomyces mirabilis]|uniref:hypothetical protein n=1 Tax=Streptomyces mirabilis TaxID=68239 RepID=UPI0036E3B648
MRSIGLSVSSALTGVVLAKTSVQSSGLTVPSLDGFRISFLIAAGAVLIALAIAVLLPGQRFLKPAIPPTGRIGTAEA